MTIKQIVDGSPHAVLTIGPDASIAEAVAVLSQNRIGALPVVEGGRVAGIFSERDVIHCLARNGAAAMEMKVSDGMTAEPITVAPEEPVLGALSLMTQRRIRHLPVIEQGALAGFVSIGDLVKHRIEKIEAEADAMRSYIQSA